MKQPFRGRTPASPRKSRILKIFLLTCMVMVSGDVVPVWAFQSHPSPEGHYAHQLAHLFFAASMGILAYWLHRDRRSTQIGWRLIQASCVLLVAWNLLTFCGHGLDNLIFADGELDWKQRLTSRSGPLAAVYFILKLDHFWSVPAILCLVLGLRSLYKQVLAEGRQTNE